MFIFLLQDEIPASSAQSIINAGNSLTADQCTALDNSEIFIHLVEMSENGFLGVYQPDSTQVNLQFFSMYDVII